MSVDKYDGQDGMRKSNLLHRPREINNNGVLIKSDW